MLQVTGGYAYLQDISGREMGRTACSSHLLSGSSLSVGGKEVEVESIISKEDFMAVRPFLKTSNTRSTSEIKQISLPKTGSRSKAAVLPEKENAKNPVNTAVPSSAASKGMFKTPLLVNTVISKKERKEPQPRHDPTVPGAIVMRRPRHVPKGKQIVDVVVDPLLTKHLREHQREGVKFMYECVMGMRDFQGQGAILADEMGLGSKASPAHCFLF